MKVLTIAAVIIGIAVAGVLAVVSQPEAIRLPRRPAPTTAFRPTVAIAPLTEALTFARVGSGATARTIAVTLYRDGIVSGVDLTPLLQPGEDAIALYNRLGRDPIVEFVAGAANVTTAEAATLAVPVDLRGVHAAAATNYPEHADEADVEDGPFMFAKVAQPTPSRSAIPASVGLLDYEVELCLVTLTPLRAASGAAGGLILCNDVTDRAALMRGANLDDVSSAEGFTDGKSGRGFLPVGDLFVVPRDLHAFVAPLELSLSVNGEERQHTRVTEWIWDLDRLLLETARRQGRRWTWRQGSAQLPVSSEGVLPDRTLVLAGTPSGTIFQSPGIVTRTRGAVDYVAAFGRRGLVPQVIDRTIADGHASGAYLRQGDRVTIRVDRMGVLDNAVR